MDWAILQEEVRGLIPPRELEPSSCWVGVLHHDKDPQKRLTQDDFLWMIGRGKTSLQKIHDNYGKRFNITDFHIQFRNAVVEYHNTISTFQDPDDNLILFMAVLAGKAPDVPEPANSVASHTTAETPPMSTDLNNQGSLEIFPNSSTLVSLEDAEILTKKEPQQIGGMLSISPLRDLIDDSFPIGRSENGYRTPSRSETESPTDHFIQEIIAQGTPDVLEAGVAESLSFLATLRHCFAQHSSPSGNTQSWVDSIDKLSIQHKRKRTIIGVVGNTGAGKSSVINALLDEERLLPTNCMRACTAVVTEVSWNCSEDPTSKYRAQIEFIAPEDWKKELGILIRDFLTDSGKVCREASDINTDAGVAWAKFRAVYPHIKRESLDGHILADLMAGNELDVLGTTRVIEAAEPAGFYQELQKYVDSKEKAGKKVKTGIKRTRKRKSKNKASKSARGFISQQARKMELWPLIKVVRIYTKSPALSTGAVIVDLPGVHDSNAARSAVAQRYMQQCTGLWIVAPITRAVDDKAAKTLLGESFKMQLKYDGGFSSVTFVCSKTDDISIMEAVEALGLQEKVADLRKQEIHHMKTIETIKDEIVGLQQSREMSQTALENASEEFDEWIELQDELDDGKVVYAPTCRVNKRKKITLQQQTSKRTRVDDCDMVLDGVLVGDGQRSANDSDVDELAVIEPLQASDIRVKLKQIRETKKSIKQQMDQIRPKIDELRTRISNLSNNVGPIRSEIRRICISGRNEYSKSAIKQDFAAGIKELDQEVARETDEHSFNPDEEIRDYDEIAQGLPVFCVSSRAYQHRCGRFRQDDAVPGFTTLEQTEVPQLQLHCQELTKAGRIQTGRSFLLNLCQHLRSLELWTSDKASCSEVTEQDKLNQNECMERGFTAMQIKLQEIIRVCIGNMKDTIDEHIFSKYPEVIDEATVLAPETVGRWGANKNDGGLCWGTYRAVVRRNGKYQSRVTGQRDFNAELVNPIVKKLATGWERSFQNSMPRFFREFIEGCIDLILSTHETIEQKVKLHDAGSRLSEMKTQTSTYQLLFADLDVELSAKMNELQREANRVFASTIAKTMGDIYDKCANERGVGCFARMKEHMAEHIDVHRRTMFTKATREVKIQLQKTCDALESLMLEKTSEFHANMRNDYMRALGSIQTDASEEMKTLRKDVLALVWSVNGRFEPIARGEFTRVQGIGDAHESEDKPGGDVVIKLEPGGPDTDVTSQDWTSGNGYNETDGDDEEDDYEFESSDDEGNEGDDDGDEDYSDS